MKIKIKKLHESAKMPSRATENDAGADLFCIDAFSLLPGERKRVRTGLAVEIPPGYYGRIAPRSGLANKHGIHVLGGVVDSDYRGGLDVILIKLGDGTHNFNAGDAIAQLIVERIALPEFEWSNQLSDTKRGENGFGSTEGNNAA